MVWTNRTCDLQGFSLPRPSRRRLRKVQAQGVLSTRRTMWKRMMMAPSIGHPGGRGVDMLAFVTGEAPLLRGRTSSTSSIVTTTAAARPLPLPSSSLADDSFNREFGGQSQSQTHKQQQRMTPRPDEPNLFDIPQELHPTYAPVPTLLQVGIAVASAILVGRRGLSELLLSSSFSFRTFFIQLSQKILLPISSRKIHLATARRALSFLLRAALVSTIAKLAIQEAFYPPSRVTTKYLAKRGALPSRLSRYTMVTPMAVVSPFSNETGNNGESVSLSTTSSWNEEDVTVPIPSIGVHSLQYTQQTTNNNGAKPKYDGIYLHHGFGASSLSWLPVLPSLVEQLGKRGGREGGGRHLPAVGVAHDSIGFGLTDRPNADVEGGLEQYGVEKNVGIALTLLKESLSSIGGKPAAGDDAGDDGGGGDTARSNDKKNKSIAIFGHSMGSRAALLMAYHCASHPNLQLKPNLVVLVAPALVGVALPSSRSSRTSGGHYGSNSTGGNQSTSWTRRMARRVWITWRKVFLDYPFRYGLRRLVSGSKGFWRKGLALAWGDPHRLSDSDVLRFQWPSIGRGWEMGLINFSRSQLSSSPSNNPTLDDGQLLHEVANLKDTKVVVLYGSKDGVVRIEGPVAERIKKDYPNVKVVRMEGLGHDPFEEDVDGFLLELEKVLLEE